MARTTSRGRSRINLYAEAVRIFCTDDLFRGDDAMTDNDETRAATHLARRTCNRISDHERGIPHGCPDNPAVWRDWTPTETVTPIARAIYNATQSVRLDATDPDAPDVLFDEAAREREREYDEIASEASATVTDDDMGAALDAVLGDLTRVAVSIRVVARILVGAHSAATKRAASLREAQRRTGHAIDTRADYAEGSAAAYSFALSALEGAAGSPRAILVGQGWLPPSGMAAPVLPDGVAVVIAVAALETEPEETDDGDYDDGDDAPIP